MIEWWNLFLYDMETFGFTLWALFVAVCIGLMFYFTTK